MKVFSKIFVFLALFLVTGCANMSVENSGTIKITASFYPLAEFATQVGGDKVEVYQVLPPGAGPHEFEPTPRDLTKIYDADIFLMNGVGLDPWGDKIKEELEQKGVIVIRMSDNFQLLDALSDDEHHDGEIQSGDPHFWLDPIIAKNQVELISRALISMDAKNADYYQSNAKKFEQKLEELNQNFVSGLADCTKDSIITTHTAFGYLANRYNFKQIGILGISTQEEPSAKKIAALSDLIRNSNLQYVLFESTESPKLAQTLADEVHVKTLGLNTVASLTAKELEQGKNYATLMEENLANLKIALQCR